MRLAVYFSLENERFPLDYRRGFASFLKKALQEANPSLFSQLYESRATLKPFTFSGYFPGLKGKQNGDIVVGNSGVLFISTYDHVLFASFYNGFLKLRKEKYPLFENAITIQNIVFLPTHSFTTDSAELRTMAPVVINTKGNKEWYLLPENDGFLEALKFHLGEIARQFLNWKEEIEFHFNPLAIKRKVVTHYNQSIQGFEGVFQLKAHPEILRLVYDVGIGARRSQGFGMVKVV